MLRRNFIAAISAALFPGEHTLPACPFPHPAERIIPFGKAALPEKPLTPPLPNQHLTHWLRIPQQTILTPKEVPQHEQALTSRILHHIHNGTPISITYQGGTQPGTTRTITPVLLFQKIPNPYVLTDRPYPFDPSTAEIPPTYLLAHCHLRQTTRTFRLSRIQLSSTHS